MKAWLAACLLAESSSCSDVLGSSAATLAGECLARCFFAFEPPTTPIVIRFRCRLSDRVLLADRIMQP